MLAPVGLLVMTKLIGFCRRDRSHEKGLYEESSTAGRKRQKMHKSHVTVAMRQVMSPLLQTRAGYLQLGTFSWLPS